MKRKTYLIPFASFLAAYAVFAVSTAAAVELTEQSKAIEAAYAALEQSLKEDIEKELPAVDEAKVAVWKKALKAVEGPSEDARQKLAAAAKMRSREGELRDLEYKATYVPKMLADAEAGLKRALAMPESDPGKADAVKSAEGFLASRKKEADGMPGRIEKAKAELKEAEAALPAAIKEAEAAKAACEKARAAAWKAMDAIGVRDSLASDELDGKLAQYTIIKEATPRDLAEFAQQSPENEKLIQDLLADKELMVQMLVADGPTKGNYGRTMQIYTAIQKASPRAKEGVFQRLALAVSLAHAAPIAQRSAPNVKDATEYVDPVKRYLSYEKWYLDGELGQGFKGLSVWNLAMVVGGSDPDEVFVWGRTMLRNLRPDFVPADGDTSKYVDVVDSEIQYTSKNVKDDDPNLHFMQNILANGGICGRRAFFGRFILRSFGVPTTARKQPGHATLAHWHPDGWKTRLGGDWGPGARGRYSTMNRARSNPYGPDVNFLASSQAREDKAGFIRVKRAQWIGALVGEEPMVGFVSRSKEKVDSANAVTTAFWNVLALFEQERIIARLEAKAADAPEPEGAAAAAAASGPEKITVDGKDVITIPSAACSSPTESTKHLYKGNLVDGIVFMKSSLGGRQLHLGRYSKASDIFEYTFDAPKAGKYQLVARIVTPKINQRLFVSANGAKDIEMPLPYTIGMWDKSMPLQVELKEGKNVLKLWGPARVSVKDFVLTPAVGK